MDNKYYKTPKSSWLMRQFWKACGADRYLLERSTYSDQIKYFCLGGIVIATGVLAGVAGGYAIYTIFEPREQFAIDEDGIHMQTLMMATIFGIVWGLIIFNIDRFIVTSTGKGDGTEKITRQEFFSAIPRIIMGIIIALTISKPIEIRIFQKEIEAALTGDQQTFIEERSTEIRSKYETNHFDRLNKQEAKARAIESDLNSDIDKLKSELKNEEQKCPPGKDPPCRGPEWYDIKKQLSSTQAQVPFAKQEMREKLAEINEEKQKYLKKRNIELKNIEKKAQSMGGLLKRIQLAHKVAGWEISLFITLLFMVIELTPIFFKMMLIKGPYDYMDDNTRELAKAEAGIEIEYDFYTDKEGVERHKVINHAAEMKRKEKLAMIQAQEELNEEIIKRWKEKKKKEIEENPDKYIDGDIG